MGMGIGMFWCITCAVCFWIGVKVGTHVEREQWEMQQWREYRQRQKENTAQK